MPDIAFIGMVVAAMSIFALVLAYEAHQNR